MRIAMAQITSGTDPTANLAVVESAAADAAAGNADLVVFPEATMCRFGVPLGPVAEPLDGPWASGVSEIAARHGLTVVAGMFTPDGERVRNTLVVAAPDGTRLSYDKIHLYDAFGFAESRTVAPGTEPLTFDVGGVTVGVATCYDIRFPALFTELARRGAELIVVPASWGAGPGKVHQWEVLATARALDSTAFVAAVGQAVPTESSVRESSAPTGTGHSQLTDPFGSVVAAYDEGVQVGVHDVDVSAVEKARTALAVLDNQRPIPQVSRPITN
ncbi:carbon-nitrogen hydrolase family protein [Gordonia insulae]|uniref:Hydrolase n=1 Tax=Gordonia insulae TaxID=2420509 RepID=A0A3G8JPM9_9ACTN|nr:carbon-nitrogen hydrolase family protein [Gordonia insulae]AZG46110.1 Hydrolase [Gordonia insulae]